jgi:hypothetical protein
MVPRGRALQADQTRRDRSTLTDTTFGLLLHDTYGWSTQRIERWTIATIRRLLLSEPRS